MFSETLEDILCCIFVNGGVFFICLTVSSRILVLIHFTLCYIIIDILLWQPVVSFGYIIWAVMIYLKGREIRSKL